MHILVYTRYKTQPFRICLKQRIISNFHNEIYFLSIKLVEKFDENSVIHPNSTTYKHNTPE